MASVELLKSSFSWIQISPNLHMLLSRAADFMSRFASIGLYMEKAVESRPGHCNQHAARFTAATELQSCASVLRSTALAGAATDTILRLRALTIKRTVLRNHPARTGDGRREENTPGVRHCRATTGRGAKERKESAKALIFDALERIKTYHGKMSSRCGWRIDTRRLMQPKRSH